jgi:hypothetical protein
MRGTPHVSAASRTSLIDDRIEGDGLREADSTGRRRDHRKIIAPVLAALTVVAVAGSLVWSEKLITVASGINHVTSPTPPPRPPALSAPVVVDVHVSIADVTDTTSGATAINTIINQVNASLIMKGLNHKKAAFVLVFASAPSHQIQEATSAANTALHSLQTTDPIFESTKGEAYWSPGNDLFEFRIYFFT